MDITSIDYWATGRSSFLHRISLTAKLLAWALVLAAVIVSQNVLIIVSIYLALVAVLLATRLPAKGVMAVASYPIIFALVFAASQWTEAGYVFAITILAKATAAALDTVLLIATTPYPQIFGFIQRFVPATIGDGLLMAYRSSFILMDRFQHVLRSIRLRGGLSARRLFGNLRNVGVALATLFIDSVDYSQRLYAIMRVRGYEKRLAVSAPPGPWGAAELGLAAGGVLLLATSTVFRIWWQTLNPVSWLPVPLALTALAWQGVRSWNRS